MDSNEGIDRAGGFAIQVGRDEMMFDLSYSFKLESIGIRRDTD